MFLRSLLAALLILIGSASAQTPGNFVDGQVLGATQLNTNLSSKANTVNGVLTTPTLNGATINGHVIFSATGTPSVTTGAADCGTAPAIAGSDNNGRVTVGTSTNGAKCTLTFFSTWTNAPTCSVWNETSGARSVFPVSATGTLVITAASTLTAADKLGYSCAGY